jgi:hypothetical protein
MRVQVYSEELGEGVEIVTKTAAGGEVFYGLRVWLKTCRELLDHSTPEDDDRSAVTFWARSRSALRLLVADMSDAVSR